MIQKPPIFQAAFLVEGYNKEMALRKLRIHGDNIIECERALRLIAQAFMGDYAMISNPPFMPAYELQMAGKTIFTV